MPAILWRYAVCDLSFYGPAESIEFWNTMAVSSTLQQPALSTDEFEQDEVAEKKRKNLISSLDYGWALFHILSGLFDIFFILQDQRSVSLRDLAAFSISTSVWCSVFSCLFNITAARAILTVEPFPIRYSVRVQNRRDDIYRQCASLFARTITFSAFSILFYSLLSWFDSSFRSQSGSIVSNIKVLICSWICLLFQRPRHWMCAPGRFLVREARFFELQVGQSGIHRLVSWYMFALVLYRLYIRRWPFQTLDLYESGDTKIMFLGQVIALYITMQILGWTAWRVGCLAARAVGSAS